jgi:hypothetical protein
LLLKPRYFEPSRRHKNAKSADVRPLFCEGLDSVRTLLLGRRTIKAAGIPL